MVVRLLLHPLAEDICTFLSIGLILLSAGLIGSVLWMPLPMRPADDSGHLPSYVSAAAGGVSRALAPASLMSFACNEHSGFLGNATPASCQR